MVMETHGLISAQMIVVAMVIGCARRSLVKGCGAKGLQEVEGTVDIPMTQQTRIISMILPMMITWMERIIDSLMQTVILR